VPGVLRGWPPLIDTEAKRERIKNLWEEKDPKGQTMHSLVAMAQMLGVKKNALVGILHRNGAKMGLAPRPNPVGPRKTPKERTPVELRTRKSKPLGPGEVSLPSLSSLASAPTPPAIAELVKGAAAARMAGEVRPVPRSAPPHDPGIVRPGLILSRWQCEWLNGDGTGPKKWDRCEDRAVVGKPYCPIHSGRAFVKIRDRRDDAQPGA